MPRFSIALLGFLAAAGATASDDDPYLWLEEVEGEKALAWVEERSAADTAELEAVPEFAAIHAKLLEIFNSDERIPTPRLRGAWIYNFWQDAEHVRGIWRRTTLDGVPSTKRRPGRRCSTSTPWPRPRARTGSGRARPACRRSTGAAWCAVPRRRRRRPWTASSTPSPRPSSTSGFALPEAKSHVSWKDEDTLGSAPTSARAR